MATCQLTENDIPGSFLCGRDPASLKNEELKFWLQCRGDSQKGLKTKAALVKSVIETIQDLKSLFQTARGNRQTLLMQGRVYLEDCGDEEAESDDEGTSDDEDGGYETSSTINELS